MKTLFCAIFAFILTFVIAIFFDGAIVNYILSQFPPSLHEWFGLIKMALWVMVLMITWNFAFFLAFIAAGITAALVD